MYAGHVPSQSSLVLAFAIAGAALFAAFRTETAPATRVADGASRPAESLGPSSDETGGDVLPPNHPPIGDNGAAQMVPGEIGEGDVLPPNHPPIGGGGISAPPAGLAREDDAPPVIAWKVPAKWTVVPNASAMRLATYHVPAAAGAADEAELTVVRAGGSTEANLQRWVGQFADAEPARRAEKTVNGRKVSMLEMSGTFQAAGMGMAPGAASGTALPRRGWTLAGAVVETEQGAYFFKMTGPSASVRAARADFDTLVNSIAPVATAVPL